MSHVCELLYSVTYATTSDGDIIGADVVFQARRSTMLNVALPTALPGHPARVTVRARVRIRITIIFLLQARRSTA